MDLQFSLSDLIVRISMIVLLGRLCKEMKTNETVRIAGDPHGKEDPTLHSSILTRGRVHRRYHSVLNIYVKVKETGKLVLASTSTTMVLPANSKGYRLPKEDDCV